MDWYNWLQLLRFDVYGHNFFYIAPNKNPLMFAQANLERHVVFNFKRAIKKEKTKNGKILIFESCACP